MYMETEPNSETLLGTLDENNDEIAGNKTVAMTETD
jgi:hypothetical protein